MVTNRIAQAILSLANQVVPDEAAMAGVQPFKLPKSALVIPSLFIGDNILMTAFLRDLRHNMGDAAQIDILSTAAMMPFYEPFPGINTIWREKLGPLRKPKLFLESRNYDTVFLCRYAPVWGAAAERAKIPQRVGFDLERLGIYGLQRWGNCLTHPIPSRSIFDLRSQAQVYLDMLKYLGLRTSEPSGECCLTASDDARADALLNTNDSHLKILIHLACSYPAKQWPKENWQILLHQLSLQFDPVFYAIGSARDARFYKGLFRTDDNHLGCGPERFINLCGQTHVRESIALLRRMDLVITLDTSIAHMAALAKTPRLIVLYGPTNHHQWRPLVSAETHLEQVYLKLPCRPCIVRTCEHKSCMRFLSVESVRQAVERAFQVSKML